MGNRKNYSGGRPGSSQAFIIFVLLCIIAVQGYFLYKQHHPGKPSVVKKISWPKKSAPAILSEEPPSEQPARKKAGKIAIIIDDSGYSLRDCEYMKSIQQPVTISILPDLAHSREVAECAYRNNKEVMLHLPLEPHRNDEKYPDNYIIKTTMSPNTVIRELKKDLKNVPHVSGINNHMGSKATETRRLMAIIFDEMKLNNLFFIDSRVTTKSICRPLAKEKEIPFGERDIFLDNENRREYIEAQFKALEEKVEKQGYAIAIGHARKLSLQIIKEQTDRLAQKGYEFVTVESLIESFPKY